MVNALAPWQPNPNDNPFHYPNATLPHSMNLMTIEGHLPAHMVNDYHEATWQLDQTAREKYDQSLGDRLRRHNDLEDRDGKTYEFDWTTSPAEYRQQMATPAIYEQPKLDLTPTPTPPFPHHTLPTELQNIIQTEAQAKSAHPDIGACAALAICATIANHKQLEIHDGYGWNQRLNIFMIIAAERGGSKSPIFKRLMKPIQTFSDEAAEQSRDAMSDDIGTLKELELDLKFADNACKGTQETTQQQRDHRNQAQRNLDRFEEQRRKVPYTMFVDGDMTPEGFLKLLASNNGTLSVLDDEGTFFTKMNKYASGTDTLDVTAYLKAWDGGTPGPTRASSNNTKRIAAYSTFMFMVQPFIVQRTLADPQMVQVGLADRFLIARPPSVLGRRDFINRTRSDPAAGNAYDQYARRLWNTPDNQPYTITPQAIQRFDQYRNQLEQTIDPNSPTDGEMAYSKRHSSLLRLAGILHFMHEKPAATPIDVDGIEAAIELAQYFIDHYEHIAGVDDDTNPDAEAARRLLAWAGRRRAGNRFVIRDIQQSKCISSTHPKAEDLRGLLGVMIDSGYLYTSDPETWHVPKPGIDAATFWPNPEMSQTVTGNLGTRVLGNFSNTLQHTNNDTDAQWPTDHAESTTLGVVGCVGNTSFKETNSLEISTFSNSEGETPQIDPTTQHSQTDTETVTDSERPIVGYHEVTGRAIYGDGGGLL